MRPSKYLRPSIPALALLLYVFAVQAVATVYTGFELSPPAAFEFLNPFAFVGLLCWWVSEDSRRIGFSWPLDLGMFLYAAWIFIVPYYLVRTRGIKGLIGLLAFLVFSLAGWIVGVLFLLIMYSA